MLQPNRIARCDKAAMPNFVLLATAWGPKYGGINAFNMDFASGLACYLGDSGQVFCAVFRPTAEDCETARAKGVHLSEAQFASGRYPSALNSAKIAISKVSPFAQQYPAVYNPWLGYGHRVCSEAYLRLERIDEAAVEARAAAEIWAEIAVARQNFEPIQVAKSFLALMQCELTLKRNDAALSAFCRAKHLLQVPLSVNPKPLEATVSKMTNLARTIDPAMG